MHRHRANISEADKSLWERADAVCRAIMAVYGPPQGLMPTAEEDFCCVKEVFDAYAIVEKAEKYYRIDYTMGADGTVTLADPIEVEEIYKPVAETARPAHDGADPAKAGAPVEISESHGALLEATSETGSSWRVLLIKAGLSGNGRRYPPEVLQQAAPLFEGVKAYADHPSSDEKRHRPERSIRDVVGWYDNVSWSDEHNGLTADFHLVESADWLRQSLKSSWDKGKPDLLGFSINASGVVKRQPDGTALLEGFESVVSTDVVTTPGAGGRLLGVLESERSSERVMDPEEIKRLIQESLAASTTSLMAAFDARLSAIATTAAEPIVEGTAAKVADPATALLESVARKLRAAEIKDAIREAKLPDIAAKRVEKRLLEALERRTVEDSEIAAAVEDARELIAAAPARPSWGGQPVLESGDDFRDKFSKGIQGFFLKQDVDGVPAFRNLHQMDMRWQTGMGARNYDPTAINGMSLLESLKPATRYWHDGTAALLESLTTSSWGEVFADNLYKMMLKEYNAAGKYSAWRLLVSETEDLPSFQTRHWTRTGGYGDLSTVAEAGTYLSLTSPADEEVSYAPAKRGGLEDLTFEMLQDPTAAGKIRTIPTKMARSAARTLYKFVFNTLLADNPTMDYDSVALFHSASHGNTDTSAGLSVGTLQTGRQKMRDQAAYGESNEILGDLNTPRYLLVPNELQAIADRICNSNHPQLQMTVTSSQDTSQLLDPNMFRGMLTPIVVDIWSDANDWMLVADPSQVNTIVLGFLNGREEPEMFVQDNPTVGSAFSSDKIVYKIRHIYGGDVADHRSFYRGQG